MKLRYFSYVGAALAVLGFQGCGEGQLATVENASGEVSVTAKGTASVSGYLDLGACNANNAGHTYYVPSTSQLFTCSNGFWTLNGQVSGSVSAGFSNCNTDTEGSIKYSEDTETYYRCSNGVWQVLTPNTDASVQDPAEEPTVQPDIVDAPSETEVVPPDAPIYDGNTFVDARDGKVYAYVVIGTQIWMAENLNYEVGDGISSWCGAGDCGSYGRLYNWPTAQNVCPGGWHLPNDDEYKTLWAYVDANNGAESVETSLKSIDAWDNPGTDMFGFAALPSGYYWSGLSDVGSDAAFWSSSEDNYNQGYDWRLYHGSNYDNLGMPKEVGFAVRCLYDGTVEELNPPAVTEPDVKNPEVSVPKDTVAEIVDGDLTASGMIAVGRYVSCEGVAFDAERSYVISLAADVRNCARSGTVLSAEAGTAWKMSYKANGEVGCQATVTISGTVFVDVKKNAEIKSCKVLEHVEESSSSSEKVVVPESSSKDAVIESSSSEEIIEPMSSAENVMVPTSSAVEMDECEIYDCVTTQFLNQEMLAAGEYGKMIDTRDNKLYRTIKIGSQTWVAQNLDYVTVGGNADDKVTSWCLNNDPSICKTDGRLYWWSAAMDIDSKFNNATASDVNIRGLCPEGWHVPTNSEWRTLYDYVNSVNGTSSVGAALNSSYAWKNTTSASENKFGFSAIPAGIHSFEWSSAGEFSDASDKGRASFWSSTQVSSVRAYRWFRDDSRNPYQGYDFYNAISDPKVVAMSVRCIQD